MGTSNVVEAGKQGEKSRISHCILSEFEKHKEVGKNFSNVSRLCEKKRSGVLTGVAQWVELCPANRKVASSIPGQGTYLGCRPGPQLRACERQPIDVSLPFFLLPFPSLKINK